MDISHSNIEILQPGYYEITGETYINNIYIKAQATVVLDNVIIDLNRDSISKAAIMIDRYCDVTLIIRNQSIIKSGYNYAGIQLIGEGKVTIKEDELSITTNELTVQSGEAAAGIGGAQGDDFIGDIIIESGNINIISLRDGAGIGGGNGLSGEGDFKGTLVISGGNINITQGFGGGSGIGGGCRGSFSGLIEINNGVLISSIDEAGMGAGIGGGYDGNFEGNVIINGGKVDVVGGEGCAGIGSGIAITQKGDFTGKVIINSGEVRAIGGVYYTYGGGAGIGSGFSGDFVGDIKLNGGDIDAKGGSSGSDFGSGTGGSSTGTISEKVKSIEITPQILDLQIGQSKKIETKVILIANVQGQIPDYTKVTYSSKDTNIATVDDNGIISAVGDGNTEITVTSVVDNDKSAICYISVESNVTIIGDIDLLICVPKNEIQLSELYNIVCVGNNPIITYEYKDSSIKDFDVYVDVPCSKTPVQGKAKYKSIMIYLSVNYSIALYSGDRNLQNLIIYALEQDNLSTNLSFCTNINGDIDINQFKILIMPYYEIDTAYSNKYYIFKIKGNVGISSTM